MAEAGSFKDLCFCLAIALW